MCLSTCPRAASYGRGNSRTWATLHELDAGLAEFCTTKKWYMRCYAGLRGCKTMHAEHEAKAGQCGCSTGACGAERGGGRGKKKMGGADNNIFLGGGTRTHMTRTQLGRRGM